MASPLKPQFDLSKISNASKVHITKAREAKKEAKNPIKMGPELIALFSSTVDKAAQIKEEAIKNGELDRFGNPIGTEYYDEEAGEVKRARKKETTKRRRVSIKTGMIFGELIVRRKGPKIKAARPNLAERWRCECSCGKLLIVPRYYLLRPNNPKTHCGHLTATTKSLNQREYRIWMMIYQRTTNPNHGSFKHYHERGITMFEEWLPSHKDGFDKFLAHVGKAPGNGYSMDRIHNGRGYLPGNLRWATAKEQRANQGDSVGGYSEEEILEMGLTEDEVVEKILKGEL